VATAIINLEKRKINFFKLKKLIILALVNYLLLFKLAYCNERGKILSHVAGCYGCHTLNNKIPFSGGYEIKTKYGTLISPNITFDKINGIGKWNIEDFSKAIKLGISPDKKPYYPALPYKWYSNLNKKDIADIYYYLKSLPTSSIKQKPHNLKFPYNIRNLLWIRRMVEDKIFSSKRIKIKEKVETEGAYIVRTLAHCGACHSPRTFLSIIDNINDLSGNPRSSNKFNDGAPNISNNFKNGIGSWDSYDLVFFLKNGFKPNGDYVEGHMSLIIENGTSFLSENELKSVSKYLLSEYNN
tara:strand:+ start:2114 stop:3007 length:894 start_codon:yes stop_codon:yes gene_type:complete